MTAPDQTDDLVGRTGEPFEFRVELGKIREFARAIASRDPAFADGEVTPPSFLMVADHCQRRQNSPWDGVKRNMARTLHAEQEFIFHGPPPGAGVTLQGQSRFDKRYQKEGKRGGMMTFTEVVTEYRDENDQIVAEVRSTTVETSKAASQ
jgi:uncharacterized membrane-anchored protein